ncbi:MAG: hypothetical protein J6W69_04655, partial [Bacteroidales bacterium]|nr:hypothetical protein [Bacteroidales bacterium]
MQYFQIAQEALQQVLRQGLSLGADYVDIYLEHSSATNVSIMPTGENRASQNIDYGAGVRVIEGEKTGYAYTEQITPESLMQAVRQAAGIRHSVKDSHTFHPFRRFSGPMPSAIYTNHDLAFQPDGAQIERLVSYLREMREKLFAADGRIVNVGGVVRNRVKRVAIVNSLGIVCEEERPMTDVTLNAVIRH